MNPAKCDRNVWREDFFLVRFYVFCLMNAQWITILISCLKTSHFHLRNKSLWYFGLMLQVYVQMGTYFVKLYIYKFPFLNALTPYAFGGTFGKFEAINSVSSV
jgi:hypothetical protein